MGNEPIAGVVLYCLLMREVGSGKRRAVSSMNPDRESVQVL